MLEKQNKKLAFFLPSSSLLLSPSRLQAEHLKLGRRSLLLEQLARVHRGQRLPARGPLKGSRGHELGDVLARDGTAD